MYIKPRLTYRRYQIRLVTVEVGENTFVTRPSPFFFFHFFFPFEDSWTLRSVNMESRVIIYGPSTFNPVFQRPRSRIPRAPKPHPHSSIFPLIGTFSSVIKCPLRSTLCKLPNKLLYIVLFNIPWVPFQLLSMLGKCSAPVSAQSQLVHQFCNEKRRDVHDLVQRISIFVID